MKPGQAATSLGASNNSHSPLTLVSSMSVFRRINMAVIRAFLLRSQWKKVMWLFILSAVVWKVYQTYFQGQHQGKCIPSFCCWQTLTVSRKSRIVVSTAGPLFTSSSSDSDSLYTSIYITDFGYDMSEVEKTGISTATNTDVSCISETIIDAGTEFPEVERSRTSRVCMLLEDSIRYSKLWEFYTLG